MNHRIAVIAALACALPATAQAPTRYWEPFQFGPSERYVYQVEYTPPGEAPRLATWSVDIEAGPDRTRVTVRELGTEPDGYVAIISRKLSFGAELLLQQGFRRNLWNHAPRGLPLFLTALAEGEIASLARPSLRPGDVFTSSVHKARTHEVEGPCSQVGRAGRVVHTESDDDETESSACVAPGLGLPLELLAVDEHDAMLKAALVEVDR